jgi:hypothetical protein
LMILTPSLPFWWSWLPTTYFSILFRETGWTYLHSPSGAGIWRSVLNANMVPSGVKTCQVLTFFHGILGVAQSQAPKPWVETKDGRPFTAISYAGGSLGTTATQQQLLSHVRMVRPPKLLKHYEAIIRSP